MTMENIWIEILSIYMYFWVTLTHRKLCVNVPSAQKLECSLAIIAELQWNSKFESERLLITEMCNAMHSLTWHKTNFFRFPAQTLISCAVKIASLVSDVKQNQNSSSWAICKQWAEAFAFANLHVWVCVFYKQPAHACTFCATHTQFIYSAGCARD